MPKSVAQPKVTINGTEVPPDGFHSFVVDSDMNLSDMAVVQVNNTPKYGYSHKLNQGDTVEIAVKEIYANSPTTIFHGEVVGLEPLWDVNGESRVTIRAFNRLHRLTRSKKSRTFENMADQDIFSKIAQDYGLSPNITGQAKITNEHVYQHNLNDFQFLLERARKINYEIIVEDKTIHFRPLNPSDDAGLTLKLGAAGEANSNDIPLQRFL